MGAGFALVALGGTVVALVDAIVAATTGLKDRQAPPMKRDGELRGWRREARNSDGLHQRSVE
jgi:hypothetical protein